jgi:phosphoglycolate phosphatase-like HAD superfamily hydrolase
VTIVLFDIDGTLIRTGRAGSRAMDRAFDDLFGIPNAFDGIQMAGRTDKWILEDAAARSGVGLTAERFQRFRDRYSECLLEALPHPGPQKGVLPGVRPLLDALVEAPLGDDVFLALLTGNCETGARIKLEYFDLWRYFRCGAYGDDVHDRNELFAVAMRGVQACGGPAARPRDVIVVGDTPLDVACAAAAGARSVAVATGPSDAETLRRSGADVVFGDLSDTSAFLRLIRAEV